MGLGAEEEGKGEEGVLDWGGGEGWCEGGDAGESCEEVAVWWGAENTRGGVS